MTVMGDAIRHSEQFPTKIVSKKTIRFKGRFSIKSTKDWILPTRPIQLWE